MLSISFLQNNVYDGTSNITTIPKHILQIEKPNQMPSTIRHGKGGMNVLEIIIINTSAYTVLYNFSMGVLIQKINILKINCELCYNMTNNWEYNFSISGVKYRKSGIEKLF